MQTPEQIINSIEPYLTTLADTSTKERPAKRRAIEAVKKEALQTEDAPKLLEKLTDPLLTCSDSEIESVREQTVTLFKSLIDRCEKGALAESVIEKLLQHVLIRLKREATEEIRDLWMQLCVTLLAKLTEAKISVRQGELFMEVVQIAGEDPFAEVQKQCANLIVLYANSQPKSVDYACERMIRLTLPLLLHKHTAVRIKGIKAMEAVLMASPKGLHLLFEYNEALDRQPIVPSLIYDNSALVRDNLFTVLGSLLCNWSPRDRYQYGERILPIILSGTFDDLPSIQSTCNSSLSKVGRSCVKDLFDADIIKEIPQDDKQAETIGLKHLVHMCYDHSILYLLHGITDFITVRQETGLESLKLFLEYASVDDIIKSIKKIVHHLFIAFANQPETSAKDNIFGILDLILNQLPSVEIYLDVLLPRLENKALAAETNGYPGSLTVTVVMAFLQHFVQTVPMTDSIKKRINVYIEKPYLKDYVDQKTLEQYKASIQSHFA